MENNDVNNTDYLNWVLMSDPSVDLTALPPPPNEIPTEADSMADVELLNYILGNEALSSSSTAPSFSNLTANQVQHHQPSAITIPSTPLPDISSNIIEGAAPAPRSRACLTDSATAPTRISSKNSNDDYMHHAESKQHSDEEDYELSESQLKMMTSKERRQLRNKISARKFRNRRKEYITMLETEVEKQKTENSRLRLEVTWIRGAVDKLQKENDQLRLELVLCKEGIKPRRMRTDSKDTSLGVGPLSSNCTAIQASSLSPPSLGSGSMTFGHSDHSSTSSHSPNSSNPSPPPVTTDDFVEPWDLILPDDHHNSSYQLTRQQNTYLSYAVIPEWDLPDILEKKSKITDAWMPANQLIQRYPLLVPALMSIILGHTMTMTTQELVSHAKLLAAPPPPSSSPSLMTLDDVPLTSQYPTFWFGPNSMKNRKTMKIPTGEELHSIWEAQQMRREMSLETWYKEEVDEENQQQQTAATPPQLIDYCPFSWLQKQFCRFVHEQVIARYPELERPCKTYLPICDKIIRDVAPMAG